MDSFLIVCLLALLVFVLVQGSNLAQTRKLAERLSSRMEDWSKAANALYHRVEGLHQQVSELSERVARLEASPQRATSPTETASAAVVTVPLPIEVAAKVTVPPEPSPAPQPSVAAPVPVPVQVPTFETAEAPTLPSVIEAPPPAKPVSESPPPAPPQPAVAPEPELLTFLRPRFDWESLIGVRLFSWIAGISLLLGAIFFVRYSVENGWLTPPIRMALGLMLGVVLLIACELKGRDYRITANAMDAAGVGTLFATCFASSAVWHLVPAWVTALMLILVTTVAVLLSLRRDSLFIAVLGLLGGFATPILLSTGANRPIELFGYLLMLNLGLGFVALRKRWPVLLSLSVALTTFYQWGWFTKFVFDETSQLPLALGIFLLFPSVWLGLWAFFRRSATTELAAWVEKTLLIALGLPPLLAVVLAWTPAFGDRWLMLFGYLFVLDVGLLVLHAYRPQHAMGIVAALATLLVWASWLSASYTASDSWPWLCAVLGLFVVLFLTPRWLAQRLRGVESEDSRLMELTAPALLFVIPALTLLEPRTSSPFVLFGTLLVLLLTIGAAAIYHRDGWLYYAAVPLAILAEATWSGAHLGPSSLSAGLAIYLTFALNFVGTPLLATRLGRELRPGWAAASVPLLNLLLLPFLSTGELASHALGPLGLMLLLLDVGLIIQARRDRRPALVWVGLAVSWLLVVLWWNQAINASNLLAALVVVFGLVMVSVMGIFWLALPQADAEEQKPGIWVEQGPFWGLVGHLFLLFVAANPELNTPPWSLLGVLLALDLAMVAVSLYLRRALIASLGLAMSVLALSVWSLAAPFETAIANAAEASLVGGALILGLSALLLLLAKRRGCELASFERSHALMLLLVLGHVGLVGTQVESPRFWVLLGAEAALLVWILLIGRKHSRHLTVFAGGVLSALGQVGWAYHHFHREQWEQQLILGLAAYLLLSAYPVILGQRAKESRRPFFVPIFASVSFFLAGYSAMKWGPLAPYMGALPLFESLVLAGLLLFILRRLEPSPPRDVGRLVLVSAVALGYLTLAMPLQLSNEWLTLGWALEAAALGWLTSRLRHVGSMLGSLALGAAVLVRLIANPAVLSYHLRTGSPFLNFYLYTYLVAAASLYGAAWFLRREVPPPRFEWLKHTVFFQRASATLLLFVLLNIEIADFYSEGTTITFRFSSTIAQDLTYTLCWAVFAILMLVVGIVMRSGGARIAALVLLTLTIAKCFLHDLWSLGGLFRVGSLVGLALCLAMVAILLQRFVLRISSPKTPS